MCRMAWLLWPVSVAGMSRVGRPVSVAAMTRIGRYLPCGVAVLARVGGRYDPYWPLCAVWRGGSGPYRWPL